MGLAVLLALWVRHGRDAGVTWDEVFQREYGTRVLAWFRSGFRDQGAMNYNDLYLYGGLFDALAQWAVEYSWLGPYETRHALSGLVAIVGVVGSWKLAAMVGGVRAGFLAAMTLALTPLWIGHGLFNPKDIPFGTAAVFASVASVRLVLVRPAFRARDFMLAGLAVGIALAVRPGGVFLFAYPCLAVAGRAALELQRHRHAGFPKASTRLVAMAAVGLCIVAIVAWLAMLSAWPWAQLSPIERPLEAMRAASHFAWKSDVLFDGEQVNARVLPRTYLLVWFGLTLPETYLFALVCALLAFVLYLWRRQWTGEAALAIAIVVVSVVLPLTAALVLQPVIYDAQRHFLFLLPPAAALAGVSVSYLFADRRLSRWLRGGIAAIGVVLLVQVGQDMTELHPYEYVYFNRLSGGLAKNHDRYETDYWGASYKEGLRWVLDNMPGARPGRRLRVTGCDVNANERLAYYVDQWPHAKERIKIVDDYKKAELFLAVQRFGCFNASGEILYAIRRQGAPLLYVKRTVGAEARAPAAPTRSVRVAKSHILSEVPSRCLPLRSMSIRRSVGRPDQYPWRSGFIELTR